jgi:hypothetical protein
LGPDPRRIGLSPKQAESLLGPMVFLPSTSALQAQQVPLRDSVYPRWMWCGFTDFHGRGFDSLSPFGLVVAFHPAASQDPTQVFLSNQLREHSSGGTIELVIVHPIHWDDPRLYFSELRASGIMLR